MASPSARSRISARAMSLTESEYSESSAICAQAAAGVFGSDRRTTQRLSSASSSCLGVTI